jgi:hypothetical protein
MVLKQTNSNHSNNGIKYAVKIFSRLLANSKKHAW